MKLGGAMAKRPPAGNQDAIVRGLILLDKDRAQAGPLLAQLKGGVRRWTDLTDREQRALSRGPLVDYLLERSYEFRSADPGRMISFAEAACALADGLETRRYGRQVVADLRARAWVDLANAYRVMDDFDRAGPAFGRAQRLVGEGTGSLLLLAWVAELMASYLADLRHFPEAISLLDQAQVVYARSCQDEAVGRTLVRLAHVLAQSNEPERAAVAYLRALWGMSPISPNRLACVHGLVHCLVECGHPDFAQSLLRENARLYRRAGRLIEYRRFWLEGKIAIGLHDYGKAEAKLNTARLAFLRVDQTYDAALVSLDLAWIYAKEGRRQEIVWLVKKMLQTFQALGIARESFASLLLLKDSCEAKRSIEALCGQIEGLMRLLPELAPARGQKAKKA